ncbi:hypothetical protein IC229_27485 [Spirosoma sp. BT702]|uniref:Uncharacterized protein n=1 Tax=Spirosoma profusum TaxID=2771354 RepID=A0A927APG1_9BACT|nr:hypothetical protein [Spirosoma profusum]MBD2704414.1 hypothetical protein [Spirosoma profusum]
MSAVSTVTAGSSNSFDFPFDLTFRPELIDYVVPAQAGCRTEGVYLTWLTLAGGWMYWLFEGAVIRGQSTGAMGQIKRIGLTQSTRKETGQYMVLHTANLREHEADALGTIRESISAYWLIHTEDDKVKQIPVNVPTGDAQLWDSQRYVNNFSVTIELPSRRSQLL